MECGTGTAARHSRSLKLEWSLLMIVRVGMECGTGTAARNS